MSRSGDARKSFVVVAILDEEDAHSANSTPSLVSPSLGAAPVPSSSWRTAVTLSPTRPAARTPSPMSPTLFSPRRPDILDDDELYSLPPLPRGPVIPPPIVRNPVRKFLCFCETSLTGMKFFEALLHVTQLAPSSLGFVPPSAPSAAEQSASASSAGSGSYSRSFLTSSPTRPPTHTLSPAPRAPATLAPLEPAIAPPVPLPPALVSSASHGVAPVVPLAAAPLASAVAAPVPPPPALVIPAPHGAAPFVPPGYNLLMLATVASTPAVAPLPQGAAPIVMPAPAPLAPALAALGLPPPATTPGLPNSWAYGRNAAGAFLCPHCGYTDPKSASVSQHASSVHHVRASQYKRSADQQRFFCPYDDCLWHSSTLALMSSHVSRHTSGVWCPMCHTTMHVGVGTHLCPRTYDHYA